MLRCTVKIDEYHPAYMLIEVECPTCKSFTMILGVESIKGLYNMRCSACQTLMPPISRMLRDENHRKAWHRQQSTNCCYGDLI